MRTGNVQRGAAAAAVAAALLGGTAQAADDARRAELEVSTSARTPGAPTGLSFRILFKSPNDPNGKPPALTRAAFVLPAGLRFDTTAVPVCSATDEQLRARGRDACPAASAVGSGTFTAVTGFGPPADPFVGDITVFNGGDQLIELVTVKDTNTTAGFDRITIEGSTLRAHPPATPGGPPDGRTAAREIRLRIDPHGRFVTNPPSCPGSGLWSSRGEFGFGDGGSATIVATTPCSRGAAPGRNARTRVTVSPRRAKLRRRVRLRVRVASAAPGCARGARVRAGSRRARTDRRGAARMALRFGRSGRRQVLVTKRGCRTARGWVRVTRR